jgi:hypothetical protein
MLRRCGQEKRRFTGHYMSTMLLMMLSFSRATRCNGVTTNMEIETLNFGSGGVVKSSYYHHCEFVYLAECNGEGW